MRPASVAWSSLLIAASLTSPLSRPRVLVVWHGLFDPDGTCRCWGELLDQSDLDLRFVSTADVFQDPRILSAFDFVLLAGADGELAELQILPYVLPADRVATLNLQQPASSFVEPTLRVALNLSFTCGSRTLPSCMQIRRDCTVEFARIRSFTSGGLKRDRYFGSCCAILASRYLSQDGAMYCR